MSRVDVLIVGAGPAGMAAAIAASRLGLRTTVVDEQPAPGGQIWRSVESTRRRDDVLGSSYVEGRAIAERFRACGATYLSDCAIWRIEPGFRIFFSQCGQAKIVEADAVILATGAQERPVPFPGWTLPGVMTVGAAQILLKNAGQVPAGPVWIAGSGPLPLLYAVQLLRAGAHLAGYLDTTPAGQWRTAVRHLPRALRASSDLVKGLLWQNTLRRSGALIVRNVIELEALGRDALQAVRYRRASGPSTTVATETLLVHEGVVPNIHTSLSLGCETAWSRAQSCFVPVLDDWGESSRPGVFIAGDGAGIAGANAALLRGELAALGAALRLGRISDHQAVGAARSTRRKLEREMAVRPFLDALFKPRPQLFAPPDETVVCRCEEITAGQIRAIACIGKPGPNQIKAASRAGMGPCQGRQCGYTVTNILSTMQNRPPADVGYLHIRAPLKPVTLGELATLHGPSSSKQTGED